jgi:hypothetical protein
MDNSFENSMQAHSDDELLDIIINKRAHYQADALAAADKEVYQRILNNPALSEKMQEKRKAQGNPRQLNSAEIWKTAKWGIMAFCIILFMYEMFSKNYRSVALVVLLNYFLSFYIVKRLIAQGKTVGHPFVFGIFVSAMILIVRFSLEMVVTAIRQ